MTDPRPAIGRGSFQEKVSSLYSPGTLSHHLAPRRNVAEGANTGHLRHLLRVGCLRQLTCSLLGHPLRGDQRHRT